MASPTLHRCLDLLRCPLSRQSLTRLTPEEITSANDEITAGKRLNRDGSSVTLPLKMALGTPDRAFLYRIEDDVPWLLPDLSLVRPEDVATGSFGREKEIVKTFYDDFGWVKNSDGKFNDTAEFTDTRSVARDYQRSCNARIGRQLKGGRFLLDVASGAIPHPEYLAFSEHYELRICIDFSVRALREARAKLGEKGIYLLGDITRLPLADAAIDSVISLHTIYHVPQSEQTTAVDELVRVTRPGGRVVIVYVWGKSLAMHALFKVRGWLGWLRRLGRPSPFAQSPAGAASGSMPPLYFHPQNYDWFAQEILARHQAQLLVWSAVSSVFQTRFLSDGPSGRLVMAIVRFLEEMMPSLAGRFGNYPMFVIDKKAP